TSVGKLASAPWPSCLSCPSRPSCPRCPLSLLTMCLRIADRMRRIGGPRAFVDADRPEAGRLKDANEFEANHLQQREERDDQSLAFRHVGEQILESARFGFREAREELLDAR